MIIPDLEKLYEAYTKDGGTLEGALAWLKKTTGAEDALLQAVVAETFIELAEGKDFSGPCFCGCGMPEAHTHIEHYMARKVVDLKKQAELAHAQVIQKNIQAMILAHVQKENDQYMAENMKPPHALFDWANSPTVKLFKKLRRKK